MKFVDFGLSTLVPILYLLVRVVGWVDAYRRLGDTEPNLDPPVRVVLARYRVLRPYIYLYRVMRALKKPTS